MLRWSVLRTAVSIRKFNTTGQVGDGREAAAADYVEAHARPGDVGDVRSPMRGAHASIRRTVTTRMS